MITTPPTGPRLELVENDQVVRWVSLSNGPVSIGRASGMKLHFDDKRVSRRHARVERRPDGAFVVIDLGSHSSTKLEGRKIPPYQPIRVKDGNRLEIVHHVVVFRDGTVPIRDQADEPPTVLGTLDDLDSGRRAANSTRPFESFQAVLDVCKALAGGEFDEMLGRSLEALMEVFLRADRGMIVTSEPNGSLPVRALRLRNADAKAPTLCRTMAKLILEEGKGVLIKDVASDNRFRKPGSVSVQLRTAICVPLKGHAGQCLGLIQLDGADGTSDGFQEADLELLAALAVPIGVVVENHRLCHASAELMAARQIQNLLLPSHKPEIDGYPFWHCYIPSRVVGGDLYDYTFCECDGSVQWYVSVGDVCGKGLPASLLMAATVPQLRHLAGLGVAPEEILRFVNRQLVDLHIDDRFVTLILGKIDPATHRVTLASAGHENPLVRKVDGAVVQIDLPGKGPPLGIAADAVYTPFTLTLAPGEVLVMHSDGLTDARNREDHRFGPRRARAILSAAPPDATLAGEALLAAVTQFSSGRDLFDDLTIVAFGRGESSTQPVKASTEVTIPCLPALTLQEQPGSASHAAAEGQGPP